MPEYRYEKNTENENQQKKIEFDKNKKWDSKSAGEKVAAVASLPAYAVQKVSAGGVGSVENMVNYLDSGVSMLASRVAGMLGFKEASKHLADYAGDTLDIVTAGEKASVEADRMISDIYGKDSKMTKGTKFVGGALESVGAMLPTIVTEVATFGVAPAAEAHTAAYMGKLANGGKVAKTAAKGLNTARKGINASKTGRIIKKMVKPSNMVFGTGAAGGYASNAYKETGDLGKSMAYGTFMGAAEVATEQIFGGFAGTDIGTSFIDFPINNKTVRRVVNMLTEGVEEVGVSLIDPGVKRITGVDKDAKLPSGKELLEAGASGILVSLLMGASTYPMRNVQRNRAINTLNSITNGLNSIVTEDVKKITPLKEDATIEEIEVRQKVLKNAAKDFTLQAVAEKNMRRKAIEGSVSDNNGISAEKKAVDVAVTQEENINGKKHTYKLASRSDEIVNKAENDSGIFGRTEENVIKNDEKRKETNVEEPVKAQDVFVSEDFRGLSVGDDTKVVESRSENRDTETKTANNIETKMYKNSNDYEMAGDLKSDKAEKGIETVSYRSDDRVYRKSYKGDDGRENREVLTKKESRYLSGNLGQNQLNTAPPTSSISITNLVSIVNPGEGEFLKYFPDSMLDSEQIEGKKKALIKDAKKIEELANALNNQIKKKTRDNINITPGLSENNNMPVRTENVAVNGEITGVDTGKTMYDIMDELGLTYDEKYAILRYKSSGSYDLNDDLRNGEPLTGEQIKLKTDMNSALDKFPVYKGVVYRNIGFKTREKFESFISKNEKVDIIKEPTFISASKLRDGYVPESPYRVHYEILSHNGKDVSNIGLVEEQEILFKTDSEFAVKSFEISGNNIKIVCEELVNNGEKFQPSVGEAGNREEGDRDAGQTDNLRKEIGDNQNVGSVRGRSETLYGISREKSSGNREGTFESNSSDSLELRKRDRIAHVSEGVAEHNNVESVTDTSDSFGRTISEHIQLTPGLRISEYNTFLSLAERISLDKLGKLLDVEIRIVRNVNNRRALGSYGNKVIEVSADSSDKYMEVVSHEITHRLQELNPEYYENYRKVAVEIVAEESGLSVSEVVLAMQELYLENGERITKADAMDEIAANFAGRIFRDGEKLFNFFKRLEAGEIGSDLSLTERRSIIRRIIDAIKRVLEKIKGIRVDAKTREHIRKVKLAVSLYEKTFSGSVEKAGHDASLKNNKTGSTRHMFAGEKAFTKNLSRLSHAKLLENNGVSASEVFAKTGWFRGADGKWRFEISDAGFRFKKPQGIITGKEYRRFEELRKKLTEGKSLTYAEAKEINRLGDKLKVYRLADIMEHEDFFKAYPKFKEMKVIFKPDLPDDSRGYYDPVLKLIYLDSELSVAENEESLLHELQHAIQHNEHFTFGATHVYWQKRIDEGLKKKSTKTGKPMTASELYKNTTGEIEARDVTKRRGMPEAERKVTLPDTGDADTLQVKGTDAGAESLTSDGDGDIIKAMPVSKYLNSSDELYERAKHVKPIEGYEDIVIHGDSMVFEIRDKNNAPISQYSPREFAEILRQDPNYHGGNIRLISCETGSSDLCAAQLLANQLGVNVLAPNKIVWIFPDGEIIIGETEFENTGKWIVFKPQRR